MPAMPLEVTISSSSMKTCCETLRCTPCACMMNMVAKVQ